ncbi:alpha/beta-hydrolase [Aulographum hederae CBS 113979]|uniref:Alpha/beta-hydrolase n=1 Tax=Aulographum hederae CBS 113979 TaxID=1176131 RepID=A0A6G1GNT3_9PEZI|nr:alpha/beta-hydrolase [Aulographum hederae CBS 113979]
MAISTPRPTLTAGQWIKLFYELLLVVPLQAARNAIPAAVHVTRLGLPLQPTLWNAIVRTLMTNVSPSNLHFLMPPTLEAYQLWMRQSGKHRGFKPAVQEGNYGKTRLMWLTKHDFMDDKVVLFFHGGGYVMPLSSGHLEWMAHLQEEVETALEQKTVGVAVLEYALVPDSIYPMQLAQAIDGLQTLLDQGFRLSSIVIGGDSAGGHLALSVLAHLLRPRDSLSRLDGLRSTPAIHPRNEETPLAGAFLVSPLVSFVTESLRFPSYEVNKRADLLSAYIVTTYGDYLTGGAQDAWMRDQAKGQAWGMALDVQGDLGVEKQWNDVGRVVEGVLITTGENEVFRDPVIEFATRLKKVFSGGVLILRPKEAHDGPLMDFSAGRPASSTTKAIVSFVVRSFQ